MTAGFDPVSDVVAPLGTVGWSVSRGWIVSREDLAIADREARDVIYAVPDDRIVRDVVGQASVASLMHLDVRLLALRREIDGIRAAALDLGEALVAALAARPGGGS